jgi:hypothetical protein
MKFVIGVSEADAAAFEPYLGQPLYLAPVPFKLEGRTVRLTSITPVDDTSGTCLIETIHSPVEVIVFGMKVVVVENDGTVREIQTGR